MELQFSTTWGHCQLISILLDVSPLHHSSIKICPSNLLFFIERKIGGAGAALCAVAGKMEKKKLCQTQKRRSEKTLMSKSQVAFCLHECSETKRAKMRSAWVAFEKSISKRCFLIPQTFWICLSWDEWSSDEKLHWFLPFCPQVGPSPTQSVRWVVLCRASLCRHQSSPWWPSLSKGQCLLTSVPWLKVTHSLRISHLPNFAAPWCQ